MPWSVKKSDECPTSRPWAVIKDSTGEVVACHNTEAGANQHMKALYANENSFSALLNVYQVMQALGISRATVYRWLDEGRLPQPVKKWGSLRWKRTDIEPLEMERPHHL